MNHTFGGEIVTTEAQKRASRKYLSKKKTITIRLDPAVAELVERRAKANDESVNSFLQRAVVRELKYTVQHKAPQTQQVGTPTDDARAAFLAKVNGQTVRQPKPAPKQAPASKPEPDKIDWRDLCMKAKAAQEEKMKGEKDT